MTKARINQGRFFNLPVRVVMTILVFMLIALCFWWLAESMAVILVMGLSSCVPPLWFSYQLLEIDMQQPVITKYVEVMGRRFRKECVSCVAFEEIHCALNKGRYQAFLKLVDGQMCYLLSGANEKEIRGKLKPVLKKMNLPLLFDSGCICD